MPEPHEVILEGEGEPGWAGAPPGDLVLLLRWQPHPTFQRRGPHLFSRVAVNFAQLIYGDTLEVETMRGFMAITIPAATAPGSMIVLREFGLPIPADSAAPQAPYGDHFIALDMQMPNVSRQEDARRLHSFCKSLGMLDRMKNPPPPPTASSRATKTSTNSFPHKNP
jgi:molecular chaperone DnaJ